MYEGSGGGGPGTVAGSGDDGCGIKEYRGLPGPERRAGTRDAGRTSYGHSCGCKCISGGGKVPPEIRILRVIVLQPKDTNLLNKGDTFTSPILRSTDVIGVKTSIR